jgi:G3E family GTPase
MRRGGARFDAVLIETTGLADPAPVLQTFFVDDDLKGAYRLDALITVVDAAHVAQHLDEERPEGVENESGAGCWVAVCMRLGGQRREGRRE